LQEELHTLARGRNLGVGRELIDDVVTPRELTLLVEAAVEVDAHERVILREHEADAGQCLRTQIRLVRRLDVAQVAGSVALAFLPVRASIGTLDRLPSRSTYRQQTHCGRSRRHCGTFSMGGFDSDMPFLTS
jgi:hypothetical protein